MDPDWGLAAELAQQWPQLRLPLQQLTSNPRKNEAIMHKLLCWIRMAQSSFELL